MSLQKHSSARAACSHPTPVIARQYQRPSQRRSNSDFPGFMGTCRRKFYEIERDTPVGILEIF